MEYLIILILSSAAFGQECGNEDSAAGKNWELTCKGEECSGHFVFKTEEEMMKKLNDFVAQRISRTPLPVPTQNSRDITSNQKDIAEVKKDCRMSFTFPNANQTNDYVRYRGDLPRMANFSICSWVSPAPPHQVVDGSLFSYYYSGEKSDDAISVLFRNENQNKTKLMLKAYKENMVSWKINHIMSRSIFCITVSSVRDYTAVFINGRSVGQPEDWSDWENDVDIPANGLLVVGHEQDAPPSNHPNDMPYFAQSKQAFVGIIENLNVWDRILNETEIQNMNRTDCLCPDDAIITLNKTMVEVIGNVTASYDGTCN